ncbi:MAG: ABC transporter ATP-binding protein, partial [Lachnospiraceae bacterium]|nr:ABC transporter ATP-binding protein [Lachnospiraceae bacterium]
FIMDEPSAALDPVSEAQLYEKTNTLLGEKTMIFISHRLSSCCFCDRILVLRDGVLLEEGSHEQLLRLGGEYRKLWEAQAVYYQAV